MNIAFYAPLKPPNHPNPSGDRLLARLFVAALERAGHRVTVASTLRSFEGEGDASRQEALRARAGEEARRLIARWRMGDKPDAWFSYHIYHKAPDWIGPPVCAALGIPYLVAEASVSPSQAGGRWHDGHEQARRCVALAAAVVVLNRRDVACTLPLMRDAAHLVHIKPFIDLDAWPPPSDRGGGTPARLVAVARMRPGDKTRSWHLLADIVSRLPRAGWTLDAVGDGGQREEIESRLRDAAGEKVAFHGRLEGDDLVRVLDGGGLFLWPAVNEAFGMVLIEAQSRGLAVAAGRNGGVAGVVYHGLSGLLFDLDDVDAAARAVHYLLRRPDVLERMGRAGRERAIANHGIAAAAAILDRVLESTCAK